MDTLMNDLENMKISNGYMSDALWKYLSEFIQKTYVPQQTFALNRPCDEKDFDQYKNVIDKHLDGIKYLLQRILQYNKHENFMTIENPSNIKTIGMHLILIIGEHSEKCIWNNVTTVAKAESILTDVCVLFNVSTLSQLFTINDDIFNDILLLLRPKLLKDVWRTYPSAIVCYKWLLHQVEVFDKKSFLILKKSKNIFKHK